LIQATIISLEHGIRGDEQALRTAVNDVVKQLILAQSHMNGSPGKPSQPSQTTTVNKDSQTDKE
jgi:hypothetical protein